MKNALFVTVLMFGCAQPDSPADPPPTYSVFRVEAFDVEGVAGVACPAGSIAVGGGGGCESAGEQLFGVTPIVTRDESGYVAACCCEFPSEGATAYAVCMQTDTAGTLQQGLRSLVDEERQRLRELRRTRTR